MMLFAMMLTVSSAMTDVVSFNNESTTTFEDIRPPVCSGVLECGKIIPNETEYPA